MGNRSFLNITTFWHDCLCFLCQILNIGTNFTFPVLADEKMAIKNRLQINFEAGFKM